MALASRSCTPAVAGAGCSPAAVAARAAPAARVPARSVVQLPQPAGAASSSGRCALLVARAASAQQATERWAQQVKDGSVSNVSPKAAGELVQQGWTLLDVRPPGEVAKVGLAGAVNVPLFVEDPSNAPASLVKKLATISTGGWWLGGTHMIPNQQFLADVEAQVPKDRGVIVGCQKGLRSLAAAESLSRAGYTKIAWINGGFDTAKPGELATTNGRDIRHAGIGGLSEALGWTEVQQEENSGQFMGGVENIFKLVALVLFADLALFGYEQLMYLKGTPLE